MSTSAKNRCEYCSSLNPLGENTCLACGGPLSRRKATSVEPKVTVVKTPSKPVYNPETTSTIDFDEAIRQISPKASRAVNTATYTYSVLWRTIAEAFAIAFAGFLSGLAGGISESVVWGLLGAVIIGVAVGSVVKRPMDAMWGAPTGALIGFIAGGVIHAFGGPPILLVLLVVFLAVLGAVLGKMYSRTVLKNVWERARPYLGAVGGIAFGFAGMLTGLALREIVSLF